MKKILAPCDFSPQAIEAFRLAMDFVQQSKGEIHLVHVVEMPVVHDPLLVPVITYEESFFKEIREQREKQFKKLIGKYGAGYEKIKYHIVFGSILHSLLGYIDDHHMDLVVMGTKGTSGLTEVLIGSNAAKMVRHSPVPVVTVKKYIKASSIKNIVFPNNLDLEQEELTLKVKALQAFFKAKLHVVWINTPNQFTRDVITLRRLKEFAKRFMLKEYTLNVCNDPYEESGVINFAHSIQADMIAMGTQGRKGLSHILSGSVAEEVVNHIDCPIWTYSAGKA